MSVGNKEGFIIIHSRDVWGKKTLNGASVSKESGSGQNDFSMEEGPHLHNNCGNSVKLLSTNTVKHIRLFFIHKKLIEM